MIGSDGSLWQLSAFRLINHSSLSEEIDGNPARWNPKDPKDPTVVRLVYILASILSAAFPGILVYLILWLVTPQTEA